MNKVEKEEKDISKLIIRLLRFHPDWIYLISIDPHKVRKEHNFLDALDIYKFFKEVSVLDYIKSYFNKIPITDFIYEFLRQCHLFIDENNLISERLEEIHKRTESLEREFNRLPAQGYSYEDKYGNRFRVKYNIEIKDYVTILDFHCLIFLTCLRGHRDTFKLTEYRLVKNLNENKNYHAFCNRCHREFKLSQNLHKLSEVSKDYVIENEPPNIESDVYTRIDPLNHTPISFTSQLYKSPNQEQQDSKSESTRNIIHPEISQEKLLIENDAKIESEREIISISKDFELYKNEAVLFSRINLNIPKFRNILREIIENEYNAVSEVVEQFCRIKEMKYLSSSAVSTSLTKFLFRLTRVAGKHFEFDQYCCLIDYFSSWDTKYAKSFSETSPSMFKNMILGIQRSGINYPVKFTQDLEKKILLFNEVQWIADVSLWDIVKISIDNFAKNKISERNLKKIINIAESCCIDFELKNDLAKLIGNYFRRKKISDYPLAQKYIKKASKGQLYRFALTS